jgi:undecaprenyl diphosphate synthase
LHQKGDQQRHVGRLERLPARLPKKVHNAIKLTRNNKHLILKVSFDYGGRAEWVDAIRRIIADGVPAEQVDEALVSRYLYTAGLPDPDLIIRTSGEMRISNFLIWQGAYAEYYVTPVFWPDFDKGELYAALWAYSQRERRFGLLGEQTAV